MRQEEVAVVVDGHVGLETFLGQFEWDAHNAGWKNKKIGKMLQIVSPIQVKPSSYETGSSERLTLYKPQS